MSMDGAGDAVSEDFDFDFSEEEIKAQLESLGYHDVPDYRLQEFKKDLQELVSHERSRNSSAISQTSYVGQRSGLEGHYQQREPLQDRFAADYSRPYKHQGSIGLPYGKENIADYSSEYEKYEHDYSPRHSYPQPRHQQKQSLRNPVIRTTYKEGVGEWSDDQSTPRSQGSRSGGHPSPRSYINVPQVLDESHASTADSESGRRVIKRKVVRKQKDGKSKIFDESFVSTTDTDVDSLQDRLGRLDVLDDDQRSDISSTQGRYRPMRPYSSRERSIRDDDATLKSLILPIQDHPHTRNIRKCDPVNRYQQFKQAWGEQKAPGEKQHKSLRWGVREQMLYHDEVVKKQQRMFVPNNYTVPTDKKRKALRWQVRADIAQGVLPSAGYQL